MKKIRSFEREKKERSFGCFDLISNYLLIAAYSLRLIAGDQLECAKLSASLEFCSIMNHTKAKTVYFSMNHTFN